MSEPPSAPPKECPKLVLPDDLQGWMEPKAAKIKSIEPGDKVCEPVLLERARRKEVDEAIFARLNQIQRLTMRVAIGVASMLAFAGLEYFGVLGNGTPPIWARAVFDGLMWMVRQ